MRAAVRTAAFAALAALAIVVTWSGCDSDERSTGETPPQYLSLSVGRGGVSVANPGGQETVAGSFGSFLPCRTKAAGDRDVVITGVEFKSVVTPLTVEVFVKDGGPALGSALGTPPSFNEVYAQGGPGGTYEPLPDRFDVGGACADESSKPELVFVVTADGDGGDISKFTVSYEADGKSFERTVNWSMVVCGAAESKSPGCA